MVLAEQLDERWTCRVCNHGRDEAPAAKAALAKELRAVLSEIELLMVPGQVSSVDEIANARAARIAGANVAGSSVRRVRQRQR